MKCTLYTILMPQFCNNEAIELFDVFDLTIAYS